MDLVIFLLTLVFVYIVSRPPRRTRSDIPGPDGFPIVGMLMDVTPDNMVFEADKLARTYGEIVRIKILGQNIIFLNSARIIRKAYTENPAKFVLNDRLNIYIMRQFFNGGDSIITHLHGFSREHDLLRKGFTRGSKVYGFGDKDFDEKFQTEVYSLMSKICQHGDEDFNMFDLLKHSVVNTVSILLQGRPLTPGKETLIWSYLDAFTLIITPKVDSVLSNFPFMRFLPGVYRYAHTQFKRCHEEVMNEFFYRHRSTHDRAAVRGLVDVLLNHQDETAIFTDERIEGIIADTVLAGVMTIMASLTGLMLCLVHHPEVQKKLQEEIEAVIGRDRPPAVQERSNFPYMEAVFLESQRYLSVSPLSVAHTGREDVNLDGFMVEKGALILTNLWHLHHDDWVWGDPWEFRPERFLDEQGKLLPRTHKLLKNVMPFGAGRRRCIGESFARSGIFMYMASLLQRWTFAPSRDRCGSCDPRSDQYEVRMMTVPKPFFCSARDRNEDHILVP